jgi:hypothetical protein
VTYEPEQTLALDVLQAALSLAVKRFQQSAQSVTDAEIEKEAESFGVGEEDADQIMLVFDLLVAFGECVSLAAIGRIHKAREGKTLNQ